MADQPDKFSSEAACVPSRPWRVVFFGSAEFSVPALRALHQGPDEVVLVVTPPPAPFGRGRKLTPSPVEEAACELGLEVLAAKSVRPPEVIEAIRAARPDLLVVAAFGGFLPDALLKMCPYPPLNIHPSLLPRHRGAAPVNWSLICGDQEVGVSIIFLEKEMDAGPILSQKSYPACDCLSAGEWEARLALVGAEELLTVIAGLKQGQAAPQTQNGAAATVNCLLCKDDGRLDWTRPAEELAALINGVDPWPGAQTTLAGKLLKVFGAASLPTEGLSAAPGQVLGLDEGQWLLVGTGRGLVALKELQPEGKKRQTASEFWRGYRPEVLGNK